MKHSSDTTLIALLERVAQREEQAFRELYEVCAPKLYGLALRIMGQRERAEDALQDAFLQIWRQAAEYQNSLSPPMAWMGIIVRSRCLDQLRRLKADRECALDHTDVDFCDDVFSDEQCPLDATFASQMAWALHQCLNKLERKQREAISLAYLRDLSHSDLARQLNQPLGTIKSWIRRGLEQLRKCMAQYA
jgi:RNA polymerase sigma factor (sigma-70 family)